MTSWRRFSSMRWVFAAAMAAVLLRAAVPLLAVAAANWRGVPVGSVCNVYGVVLPGDPQVEHAGHAHHPADHAGHEGHGPGSDESHSGEHCALTALAELAASHSRTADQVHGCRPLCETRFATATFWADASATWVARRKQGPPHRAGHLGFAA